MKYLYKYPQAAFPYAQLVEENRRRDRHQPEFELLDTEVFAENRYFDVLVEYAKASPEDILIQVSVTNRGPEAKIFHLLPTLWFRNTWSWHSPTNGCWAMPWRVMLRFLLARTMWKKRGALSIRSCRQARRSMNTSRIPGDRKRLIGKLHLLEVGRIQL